MRLNYIELHLKKTLKLLINLFALQDSFHLEPENLISGQQNFLLDNPPSRGRLFYQTMQWSWECRKHHPPEQMFSPSGLTHFVTGWTL